MDWDDIKMIGICFFVAVGIFLIGVGCFALGTATFRSHNTNPRIGTVWTGGVFSSVSEKCYGTNLIINDGNGLATIANAQECK